MYKMCYNCSMRYCDKTNIYYNVLVADIMRLCIYHLLQEVSESGLPGGHYFYITFMTTDPSVILPKRLKETYPEIMTVVLQNQFWDLSVTKDSIHVTLSFDQILTPIVIPFSALVSFTDPFVSFSLHFSHESMMNNKNSSLTKESLHSNASSSNCSSRGNVIQLDAFRSRKDDL